MTPESGAYQGEFVTWTQRKTRNALCNNAIQIVIFWYLKVCIQKPIGDFYLFRYLSIFHWTQIPLVCIILVANEQKCSCSGLSANTVYTQQIKRLLPASCQPQLSGTTCSKNSLWYWLFGKRANKRNFKAQVPQILRNVNRFGWSFSVFPIRRLPGFHRYSSQTTKILSHPRYSFPSLRPGLKIGRDSLNCTHWRYFPQQREVYEVSFGVDDLWWIFLILPSNFHPK